MITFAHTNVNNSGHIVLFTYFYLGISMFVLSCISILAYVYAHAQREREWRQSCSVSEIFVYVNMIFLHLCIHTHTRKNTYTYLGTRKLNFYVNTYVSVFTKRK